MPAEANLTTAWTCPPRGACCRAQSCSRLQATRLVTIRPNSSASARGRPWASTAAMKASRSTSHSIRVPSCAEPGTSLTGLALPQLWQRLLAREETYWVLQEATRLGVAVVLCEFLEHLLMNRD